MSRTYLFTTTWKRASVAVNKVRLGGLTGVDMHLQID
jgi:hypothetical protein